MFERIDSIHLLSIIRFHFQKEYNRLTVASLSKAADKEKNILEFPDRNRNHARDKVSEIAPIGGRSKIRKRERR